jgi:ribosomal protein S18 acetylase RimI-like enzyme
MPPADACDVVERDFVAAWWLIAEAGGSELHDSDGLRWFHTGLDEGYLNPVLATRLADVDAELRIDELLTELKGRGRSFVWWSTPSCRPAHLGEILATRGLVAEEAWPGMTMAIADLVEPPPVDGLEIRRVADAAGYDDYELTFAPILSPSPAFTRALRDASLRIGFADDAPEVHFVGYLRGEPVATTSLIMAGGAAGIYNVATVEASRGRGIGAALTAHAARFGGRRGLHTAALQASRMGRPVYERLGFRAACDLVPYRLPTMAAAEAELTIPDSDGRLGG